MSFKNLRTGGVSAFHRAMVLQVCLALLVLALVAVSTPIGPSSIGPHDRLAMQAGPCADQQDNDGDGFTDLNDPGCRDANDDSESEPTYQCDDAEDNDFDNKVDWEDPDCTGPTDNTESPQQQVNQCQDNVDNDGDGFTDANDPGCAIGTGDTSELGTTQCDDGVNNDNDQFIDYPDDPDCTGPTDNSEFPQATPTPTPTPTPTTASRARFIQLCHGSVAGTSCDTTNAVNEPGDEHELTARVTDRSGAPVANVPVQFRETGPAIFTPQGGSSATVNTDVNGLARVLLVSDVEGQSTIVAEITGSRGPGTTDDECEQPAGTSGVPAAGNCISQTLTKTWDEVLTPDPQCDDGIDNDNDAYIDTEDPGCTGPSDESEAPANPPPTTTTRHDRRISIRFQDGTGGQANVLIVFGRLRVPDGFNDCRAQQPVDIQRRVNGRWVTKKSTHTNRKGRYAVEIFDQASRYRAVAPRTEIFNEDLKTRDVCLKAVKVKRHRHRR